MHATFAILTVLGGIYGQTPAPNQLSVEQASDGWILLFDGDSTYGARDDFSWYGGENLKGKTYSLWYNHRRASVGRLFAWDIDTNDFVVTDTEIEAQGYVYKWVPAGTRVTPHLDCLWMNDIQAPVTNNAGQAVIPYYTVPGSTGVTNPWGIVTSGYGLTNYGTQPYGS